MDMGRNINKFGVIDLTNFLLSIDQGTTSSRAMLFDITGKSVFTAQQEFSQYFPQDGWVEHDPEEIWNSVLKVTRDAINHADSQNGRIVSIGITNQRETTIVWNRHTGKPVYNAIVWQDRRTAEKCRELKELNAEDSVTRKTGLLLDPYFSGTKIQWILDNVDGARGLAEKGELAFGTIDCFLIWRLTGSKVHATDATNASRTLCFNIHTQQWDFELLKLLNVPKLVLPEVLDSADEFGYTDPSLFGKKLPIAGVAGDQHAALIGQACFEPGMIKSTYGTGCFVVLNTGDKPVTSKNKLLTTTAYRLDGKTTYAIEGSIFVAGAAVQWLRDGIGIIQTAGETEAYAAGLESNKGIYMVPAFTGLGAPHWDPDARGAIMGLTRDTGIAEIVRAALEAVCYQTSDLLEAMAQDGITPIHLRVDGGMVNNNWLCTFLANILGVSVQRPVETETTALGAAYLAGLQSGVFSSLDELQSKWQAEQEFSPDMTTAKRHKLLGAWRDAVMRVSSSL
ncbi:MAG: glycerol kinase [Parasphingorhabdus sp.]|jgi:glycerol kinase